MTTMSIHDKFNLRATTNGLRHDEFILHNHNSNDPEGPQSCLYYHDRRCKVLFYSSPKNADALRAKILTLERRLVLATRSACSLHCQRRFRLHPIFPAIPWQVPFSPAFDFFVQTRLFFEVFVKMPQRSAPLLYKDSFLKKYSVRILFEFTIRNCNEFLVTGNDVEKLIDWENSAPK
ncbi:unnamed protein product [Urochloa humidicola]